jgi:hypothetical protein
MTPGDFKGGRADNYVRGYPAAAKWLVRCVGCGRQGHRADMPSHGHYVGWIRLMTEPLELDALGFCPDCASVVERMHGDSGMTPAEDRTMGTVAKHLTETHDKPGLGDAERSPNLLPEPELQTRFSVLGDRIRDAEASGDKATARRLERERRGVFHQLKQTWDERRPPEPPTD